MKRNSSIAASAALLLCACASVDMDVERAALFAEAESRGAIAQADPDSVAARLSGALSQADAVAVALAQNRGLRADLAEAGLARADWIEAGLPPNIAFHGSFISEAGEPDAIDLDFTTPLLGFLTLPARRAEARSRYDAARDEAVLAIIDFVSSTRIAWVEAVAARQRAEVAGSVRQAAEAALTAAEELRAAGNIPQVDLERERALAQRARLSQEDAEAAAMAAEHRLRARMGLEPGANLVLPDRLPEPADMAFPADPEGAALEASLAIEAARSRANAAARAADLANVESLLDHAALGLAFEREDGEWADGFVVESEIPLFNWGRARRAAARITARQALDRLAQLSFDVRTAARIAAMEAELAAGQAAYISDQILPTSEAVLHGVMREYNAMQIGVFDLIAAFENRAEAGASYVDALARHHRARIRLEQMLAGGSAAAPSGNAAGEAMGSGRSAQGDHG